jgi:hypothetical protein
MICAGLCAALAGAALAALPPPVTVGLDSDGYRLGSVRLPTVGTGSYSSAEASLVVRQAGAETVAGASSRFNGQPMTGRCVVEAAGGREHCSLTIGSQRLVAEDVRTPAGWHRRYSDGRQLDVTTLGRDAIPVPFPVGR